MTLNKGGNVFHGQSGVGEWWNKAAEVFYYQDKDAPGRPDNWTFSDSWNRGEEAAWKDLHHSAQAIVRAAEDRGDTVTYNSLINWTARNSGAEMWTVLNNESQFNLYLQGRGTNRVNYDRGIADGNPSWWEHTNDTTPPLTIGEGDRGSVHVIADRPSPFDYRVNFIDESGINVGGGPNFGRADYKQWLAHISSEMESRGENPIAELRELREDIIYELDNNPNVIANATFRDKIGIQRDKTFEDGESWHVDHFNYEDISSWFGWSGGGPEDDIEQQNKFNETDRLAMLAAGFDEYDIYQYLKRNPAVMQDSDGKVYGGSQKAFDRLEESLIERGNHYLNLKMNHPDPKWSHYMPQIIKHPVFQRIAEHMNTQDGWGHITCHTWGDYERMFNYVKTRARALGRDLHDIITFEYANEIIGVADLGPGVPGATGNWEPGEYWRQYGYDGPPDRDQGDGASRGDLSWVEKMVAHAGLAGTYGAVDYRGGGNVESRLQELENRFIAELWSDESIIDGQKGYMRAPDEWGLDIMRRNEDGTKLDFDDADWDSNSNPENDAWYQTLTKGTIDWAFYQENETYIKAHEFLGMDIDKGNERYADDYYDEAKRGKYIHRKIDTVAEIRAANVWVHGQNMVLPSDKDPALDWKPYTGTFDSDTAVAYEPREIPITNYTRPSKKIVEGPSADLQAPTINIPNNPLRVPTQLRDWDTLTLDNQGGE